MYVSNFAGLANRIEALTIAFAIQARGGHRVALDWPELDVLRVAGTTRAVMPAWRRLLRYKPRRVRSAEDLDRAAAHGTVDLRIFYGEAAPLDLIYASVNARLRLERETAEAIARTFEIQAAKQPVVGVHVRRGDFIGAEAVRYDASSGRHVAVPLWWYTSLMNRYAAAAPGVRFFVSVNGRIDDFPELRWRPDVFTLSVPVSPAGHRAHAAAVHPAADLFALAGCSVILATPMSSFSHFAANALGEPTAAVIPLDGATPDEPRCGIVQLHGRRLGAWNAACKGSTEIDQATQLPVPTPARLEYLFAGT